MKENVVTLMNVQKGMLVHEMQCAEILKAVIVVSAMRDIVVIFAQISTSVLRERRVVMGNLNALTQ